MNRTLSLVLIFALTTLLRAEVVPDQQAGKIGYLVGRIMATEHYKQHPLDDEISKDFLDIYLDDLDYSHMVFFQSDIHEFQKYSTQLDDLIAAKNIQPGFDIFNRYLTRFEERVKMVNEILKEKFDFDKDESFMVDRKDAAWPANEEEAHQIWRLMVKSQLLQEKLNKRPMDEAVDIIRKRYDRALKQSREEDAEHVLARFLTALARTYDPHSDYLSPSELKNFMTQMKLSLVGIGAILMSEDGYAKVMALVPGGPADLDRRLKVNDRIAGVAQGDGPMVDVVDMRLDKTVELIRGEKNTDVRLLVIPDKTASIAQRNEIRIRRDEVVFEESQAKAKLVDWKGPDGTTRKLGYIDLPSFYADMQGTGETSTTADMARLIERLKEMKIDGMVIDLRKNSGGSLAEVISLTGLFVKEGPVVQVKDAQGNIRVHRDNDKSVLYDGSLVVMVDHTSASASEIFAAALQDYGRAVIVGSSSTFGKGTVQKVEELDRYMGINSAEDTSGGALKVTTQKFYRISGGATQVRGVIPDIRFPSLTDYQKINESELKNPLPYDEVTPARFDMEGSVLALKDELNRRSMLRVKANPEFAYIQEDIGIYKQLKDRKAVSLNEKVRLDEKDSLIKRIERRKADRVARRILKPEVTEITLRSLSEDPSKVAALTKEVVEEARKRELASLKEKSDDEMMDDPAVDPEFDETLNIVSDMIEMTHKPAPAKNAFLH